MEGWWNMKKLIINYTELVDYLLENRGMDGYIYFYESMETEQGIVISFSNSLIQAILFIEWSFAQATTAMIQV